MRREKRHRYLPRAKATRGRRYFKRRREPIPGCRSIHERGQAIDNRNQFGHWEGDFMQFRTQRGNLSTAVERKTGLILANGLLRRDLPRKTELADYSEQDIQGIVWANNTTPRKRLRYLTPAEAFLHQHRCCT